MNEYRVTWEVDLGAGSPKHAAELARALQLDPQSLATFFEVKEIGSDKVYCIDLLDEQSMEGAK